jgi:hypothetical protein
VLLDKALCTTTGDVGSTVTVTPQRADKGRYMVSCPDCTINGVDHAGGVVWADRGGATGWIDASNSLHGTHAYDRVGTSVTLTGSASTALGLYYADYVVASPNWDNSTLLPDSGAVTWIGENGFPIYGSVGQGRGVAVSADNSLIGLISDRVGSGGVFPLFHGFAAASPDWGDGTGAKLGAITFFQLSDSAGKVTVTNSIVGSAAGDQVGSDVRSLDREISSGYPVRTLFSVPNWDGVAGADIGAVSWAYAYGGISQTMDRLKGTIDPRVAIVGESPGDRLGVIHELPNGQVALHAPQADTCVAAICVADTGAWKLISGQTLVTGGFESRDTFRGSTAGEGLSQVFAYDDAANRILVGRPVANKVSIFFPDTIFRDVY